MESDKFYPWHWGVTTKKKFQEKSTGNFQYFSGMYNVYVYRVVDPDYDDLHYVLRSTDDEFLTSILCEKGQSLFEHIRCHT